MYCKYKRGGGYFFGTEGGVCSRRLPVQCNTRKGSISGHGINPGKIPQCVSIQTTDTIPIYHTKIYSHTDQARTLCAQAQNVQTGAGQNLPVLVQDSCICTGHTSEYMTRTGSCVPFLSAGGVRGATCLSIIFVEAVPATSMRIFVRLPQHTSVFSVLDSHSKNVRYFAWT